MGQGFSGRAAVAGIGLTALSRSSGRTELSLAAEAARAALAEAAEATGGAAATPDAILSYHLNDSAPVLYLARELGITEIGWHNEIYGGGTQSASILADAAMLIDAGLARTVLVYRALNGRSGKRMNTLGLKLGEGTEEQFTHPYGMAGPVHQFALAGQRYLYETGLNERHLHAVVAQSRAHAVRNPRALQRQRMSLADYLDSPMVASPLRRVDCCQETDGACALVLTRADLAPDAPRVHAVVRGGGPGASSMDRAPDITRIFSSYVAGPLYEAAGMKAADVDVALLYDAYSWLVPRQLEDFGLVGRSDLGVLLTAQEIAWNGRHPVNPHGGLLSEGYVHGLNNVAEAVRQLRGTGTSQVADASVALCTGFGGSYGSAAVLVRP
ncbi:thiolase C-terminal domain-containing protein [Actinomadura rupiterrae]|uniref:thiolase C-terminal domain-containing protein n=1 Tax=Actinomadura rupiterrae TaxID=559627 RepID=UPI0020A304C2|nr:acetyl-CoA acetyltransferase [Actinomadura rupiterrae]MCP2339607.1 acetyl-CoA acetyltransferase [Actinomadura rupiterrae]